MKTLYVDNWAKRFRQYFERILKNFCRGVKMDALFYKELKDCREERLRQERALKQSIDYESNLEYCLFKIWCKVYKNAQYTEQNFREYAKNEKKLSFWVKKKIAETYFGYDFNYSHNDDKWHCIKRKTV